MVNLKIFGSSFDTKGREEFLGLKSCQAYQSCCVCLHTWSEGLQRGCIADGYRRFLADGSRARQRQFRFSGHVYQYKCTEVRPQNCVLRSNASVNTAMSVIQVSGQPYLGHKYEPLASCWPDFDWYRYNVPDLMHGKTFSVCTCVSFKCDIHCCCPRA